MRRVRWVTPAATQDRLDRDLWKQPRQADEMLGLTTEWLQDEIRLREQARSSSSE